MSERRFGTIVQIGDILVSEDVVSEYFSCDYAVCKGACCVEGDSGAPLEEEETVQLERCYDGFSELMSPEGREAALRDGFFAIDRDGDIVTPTVPGTNECAYAHFDADGSAWCSIERYFSEGRCGWRKPISCRLYPIRVTKLTGGGLALNLHKWKICGCAFEKGRRDRVRAYQFLKDVLVERFGADFYDALDAAARHINGD